MWSWGAVFTQNKNTTAATTTQTCHVITLAVICWLLTTKATLTEWHILTELRVTCTTSRESGESTCQPFFRTHHRSKQWHYNWWQQKVEVQKKRFITSQGSTAILVLTSAQQSHLCVGCVPSARTGSFTQIQVISPTKILLSFLTMLEHKACHFSFCALLQLIYYYSSYRGVISKSCKTIPPTKIMTTLLCAKVYENSRCATLQI
jgi:hypothetical protein